MKSPKLKHDSTLDLFDVEGSNSLNLFTDMNTYNHYHEDSAISENEKHDKTPFLDEYLAIDVPSHYYHQLINNSWLHVLDMADSKSLSLLPSASPSFHQELQVHLSSGIRKDISIHSAYYSPCSPTTPSTAYRINKILRPSNLKEQTLLNLKRSCSHPENYHSRNSLRDILSAPVDDSDVSVSVDHQNQGLSRLSGKSELIASQHDNRSLSLFKPCVIRKEGIDILNKMCHSTVLESRRRPFQQQKGVVSCPNSLLSGDDVLLGNVRWSQYEQPVSNPPPISSRFNPKIFRSVSINSR